MAHIHQSNTDDDNYIVVETDLTEIEDLMNHISIVEHPDLFEVIDTDPPLKHQKLIYVSDGG